MRGVPKNISMAHIGSISAPNAALGNGVPSLATMKASKDASPAAGLPCGCSGSTSARCAPSHPIRMAAPSGTGAAGGGAAQRSSWPGAQTAGAASTGATRAAPAPHAVVAFAPWRRQHAWNLHQRAVLVQVPLILNRLLKKECCQKIFFLLTSKLITR